MQHYEEYSDEELIRLLRGGEEEISEYLVEKYKDMVRKEARAMYLIGGETDDLIQEGMIGLFKAVRDYEPDKEASFRTFAKICVDRQIYNAIQGSNRQKHQPLNSYVSLSSEDEEVHLGELLERSPESIVIDRENVQDTERQIHQCLSKFENQVLSYYLKGYGYVKIGELLGRSPKSIDNALQRIRGKVKECLQGQSPEGE
ncbi:MAG: sigma-70 family RNA polymerase sigma factor [Blautia sp.]|jgi:RNA polymerase sporulation-specific sigma factor